MLTSTTPLPDAASTVSGEADETTNGVAHGLPVAFRVFLVAVFFVPVQLEVSRGGVLETRFAPTDALLALTLAMAPSLFKLRPRPINLIPVAAVATMAAGVILALVVEGGVTQHTLLVKFGGMIVLGLLAIVTTEFTAMGFALRITRTFLISMSFWAVLSYIDWKIANVLPLVDAKTDSRFGAMMYDPNNAGAGYAIASLLSWRLGRSVFRTRLGWAINFSICIAALYLSLSRGGYIAFLAGSALVLLVSRTSVQRVARIAMAIAVLAIAALSTGLVDTAIRDFERRPNTVTEREEIAANGIAEFVDSGGLGVGLGSYRAAFDQNIHNTGLWLVVEMGVFGLILLLLLVIVPAAAALRLRRASSRWGSALFGAHFVMVIASMNIEGLYQRPWWLVLGLIGGYPLVARKSPPTSDLGH